MHKTGADYGGLPRKTQTAGLIACRLVAPGPFVYALIPGRRQSGNDGHERGVLQRYYRPRPVSSPHSAVRPYGS
jgi:hypothetical protein